jgi:hypothetical protein
MDSLDLLNPIQDYAYAYKLLLPQLLENQFGKLSLHQLGSKVGEIEDWTLTHLKKALWDLSPSLFACNPCDRSAHIVDPKQGIVYEINVAKDLQNPRNLNIALLKKFYFKSSEQIFECSFEPFGPFSTTSISLPSAFVSCTKPVADLAKAVVNSSQAWITKSILEVATSQENHLTEQIYSKIGSIIKDKILLNHLWISCLTDRYCFMLVNSRISKAAARIFQQHFNVHSYSANRMLAELISTRLSRGGLLVDIARSQRKTIDANIRVTQYAKEGNIFSDVLVGLYGGYVHTIVPLFIEPSLSLFAHFPSEHRTRIVPTLEAQKNALSLLIHPSLASIVHLESAFEPSQHNPSLLNVNPAAQEPCLTSPQPPKHIHFVENTHSVIVDQFEVPLHLTHYIFLHLLAKKFPYDSEHVKQITIIQSFHEELKAVKKAHTAWFNQKTLALLKTISNAVSELNTAPLSKLLYDLRRALGKAAIVNPGANKLLTVLPKGPGGNIKLPKSSMSFDD